MSNTCGYGHIKDGRFTSVCVRGTQVIDNERNIRGKAGKFKELRVAEDAEICGNLRVKGCIIEEGFVEKECNDAIDVRKGQFDVLEQQYYDNGTISWATFKADQVANKEKVVELVQSDFANGTLRVQQPCLLKLKQSIQFNPNRPATWLDSMDMQTGDFSQAAKIDPNRALDWFPNMSATDNAQYFQPEVAFAYGLGFFAALAIETRDVIIDLCGYTLAQHPEHALQQRFFAVIELADQPFMPFQGPSNFGAVLRSAQGTLIKNGKIGLSSHHGVHGNDCDDVMFYNVQVEKFEVAAISLNGSNHLYMKNVNVIQNRQDVPVLATYSAGRFVKRFVERVVMMGHDTMELNNTMDALNDDMDETFNAVIFSNGTISNLFKNVSQLIDGTCYGILLNPKGVAVNTFLNDRNSPKAFETTDIHMVNCSVNGIKGNINEIVGVANPDGGMQVDTAGALLQFFNGVAANPEMDGKYYYNGTLLSEVQIELSKIKKDLDDMMVNTSFFGTLNIHPGIHLWKDDLSDYFEFVSEGSMQLFYANTDPVLIEGNSVVYDIKCNGDSMFHVNKGVIGYRIDGASTLCMVNCSSNQIENVGPKGSELCGAYVASHPATVGTNCVGYSGADSFGAVFNAVNDVKVSNFAITNVEAGSGCAHGLYVQNGSLSSQFQNVTIDGVAAHASFDPAQSYLPNMPAKASGLGVRFGCKNIKLDNVSVDNVSDNTPFQCDFNINDSDVKISN